MTERETVSPDQAAPLEKDLEAADAIIDGLVAEIDDLAIEEERKIRCCEQRLRELGEHSQADKLREVIRDARDKGRIGTTGHTYVTQGLVDILYRSKE